MHSIKCVLIDDEPMSLQLLKTYCERLPEYCKVVNVFNSADSFYAIHQKLNYDLLLIDIDMPGMKGTDLARLLIHKPVIFVTGKKDFDTEVLDMLNRHENHMSLIRKPIDVDELKKTFNKYLSSRPRQKFVIFKTKSGERNVNFDDILLITSNATGFKKGMLHKYQIPEIFDPRNKILVTKKELIQINNIDFDELEEILPPENFFPIHRSTIASRQAIEGLNSDGIFYTAEVKNFMTESYYNVSEKYRPEFKKWLNIG